MGCLIVRKLTGLLTNKKTLKINRGCNIGPAPLLLVKYISRLEIIDDMTIGNGL